MGDGDMPELIAPLVLWKGLTYPQVIVRILMTVRPSTRWYTLSIYKNVRIFRKV